VGPDNHPATREGWLPCDRRRVSPGARGGWAYGADTWRQTGNTLAAAAARTYPPGRTTRPVSYNIRIRHTVSPPQSSIRDRSIALARLSCCSAPCLSGSRYRSFIIHRLQEYYIALYYIIYIDKTNVRHVNYL